MFLPWRPLETITKKVGKLKGYIQKFVSLEVVWNSFKVKYLIKTITVRKNAQLVWFFCHGGQWRMLEAIIKKSFHKKKCSAPSKH